MIRDHWENPIMSHLARAFLLGLVLALAACSNQPPVTTNPYVATALSRPSTIALAPGGGGLALEVTRRLEGRYDFTVVPSAELMDLMVRHGARRLEAPQLGGLAFLDGTGIDAVKIVRDGAGKGDARVTVLRVPDGVLLAESRFTPRIITQDIRGEIRDIRFLENQTPALFAAIANEDDAHKASLLAADIAEALNR
jgi:hypothetical protein